MKQKLNLLRFLIPFGMLLLLISIPQLSFSQEYNDSTRLSRDTVSAKPTDAFHSSHPSLPVLFPPKANAYPLSSSQQPGYLSNLSLHKAFRMPYYTNPSPRFRGDYHTSGVWKQFSHGALLGSGGQTSLPGIGRINEASIAYQHVFNPKLSLQLSGNAMKMNMIHSTRQAFSASGTLLYRASDRVAFKAFGSYDIGNPYGMSTHRYGGTMSVDMSDRFGMEVGVQRYYDDMRGRWETVPIVIPYYRFEKFTLGLDVGGLVYEILRDLVFDKHRGEGPTIAPPRFTMPPIR